MMPRHPGEDSSSPALAVNMADTESRHFLKHGQSSNDGSLAWHGGLETKETGLWVNTLTSHRKKPQTASPSGSLSRPTRTVPIVAMQRVKCRSLPQTPTSWCL